MSAPTVLDWARRYLAAGFSVVPILGDGSKRPAVPWSSYQKERPTEEEIVRWFDPSSGSCSSGGLALVCGQVSGGFEVLDFDDSNAFEEFRTHLSARGQSLLLDRVSLTRTPRPGVHLGLRSPTPGRNQRLASRTNAAGEVTVLCETRGEGGYVLAIGCPAACHPAKQLYQPYSYGGIPLAELPSLTSAEREVLVETARLLMPAGVQRGEPSQRDTASALTPPAATRRPSSANRPGDLFNRHGPAWAELLTPHGWIHRLIDSQGRQHYRRPGKRRDTTSAVVFTDGGEELFYVYSTKAPPFEAGQAYTRFAVYTMLQHGGDYRLAAAVVRTLLPSTNTALQPAVKNAATTVGGVDAVAAALTPLAALQPQVTSWLWLNWLPCAALAILDGDPGLGKSTLTGDIAARVSTGRIMPEEESGAGSPDDAGHVLLLSAEDDPSRTILPRLRAAGADLNKVHVAGTIREVGGERTPTLPHDLALLLERLPRTRLVVIDPIMAYLSREHDACRDQDVRRCLFALSRLAEQYQTTILMVRHLNKSGTGAALYRGSGSIGILGAARACLLVGKDPDQEGQCVLAMNKCNLAPAPASLAYRLRDANGIGSIHWCGRVPWMANDLVGKPDPERRQSLVQQCAEFLTTILLDKPLPATEVMTRCQARGWSPRTVDRARQQAGVRSERHRKEWICRLTNPPMDPLLKELLECDK